MPIGLLPSQAFRVVWQLCGDQHGEVSQGQTDQVAVGGHMDVPCGHYHQDHRGITHNAHHTH